MQRSQATASNSAHDQPHRDQILLQVQYHAEERGVERDRAEVIAEQALSKLNAVSPRPKLALYYARGLGQHLTDSHLFARRRARATRVWRRAYLLDLDAAIERAIAQDAPFALEPRSVDAWALASERELARIETIPAPLLEAAAVRLRYYRLIIERTLIEIRLPGSFG